MYAASRVPNSFLGGSLIAAFTPRFLPLLVRTSAFPKRSLYVPFTFLYACSTFPIFIITRVFPCMLVSYIKPCVLRSLLWPLLASVSPLTSRGSSYLPLGSVAMPRMLPTFSFFFFSFLPKALLVHGRTSLSRQFPSFSFWFPAQLFPISATLKISQYLLSTLPPPSPPNPEPLPLFKELSKATPVGGYFVIRAYWDRVAPFG